MGKDETIPKGKRRRKKNPTRKNTKKPSSESK
jgi:hypothetical protein